MIRIIALILIAFLNTDHLKAQKFIDRSEENSFNIAGVNRGVAVGDFNKDGFEDIYICRKDGPNLLYQNLGNFQFEEVANEKGLAYSGATSAALWIDIENDGDLDLFLANSLEPCKLFKNEDDTFLDVSQEYFPQTIGNIQSANVVDYDNDGYVDIYLARFLEQNILLKNQGGNSFIDHIYPSGILDEGPSMGAIFFDYDNDGDQDLYQTRDANAGNLFFRNDDGYFANVTSQTNTGYEGQGMGVDVSDINQDGLLDIYFSNLFENVMYIQNQDHTFSRSEHPLFGDPGMGWGTLFFDSNNNSKIDLFLANDSHFVVNATHHPNKLMINRGDLDFYAPPMNPDFQNTHASYGAAYADFDNDGKLDLVVCNAGEDGNQIFQNQSIEKNFLTLNLIGKKTNSQAIGAKVEMYIQDQVQTAVIRAGHSYASQSSNRVHFGLGDYSSVDSLIIKWPSGKIQILREIDINSFLDIEEPTFNGVAEGTLVWTEPAFPTQTDDIILYFNAKEGNGGLAGFTGEIYMHAGVITSSSTSPTDWKFVQGTWGVADPKVKMKSEGDDIYSLAYNITDFYGIPPGELVEQLAFVFRNAEGSKAGRETDGGDIYLEVYPSQTGLLVNLISPNNDNSILLTGEELNISLQLNKEANITIQDNGNSIYNDKVDQLSFPIIANELGSHELQFTIDDGIENISLTRQYFVLNSNETLEDAPDETVNGINYLASSYIFQLTAPGKKHVFLLCPENNYKVDLNYKLKRSTDENSFWIELPKNIFIEGGNTYQYLVDGELKVADPFSRIVLDPSNDAGIPADVKEEIPPYPVNYTSGIVTAFDLEEDHYAWTNVLFEKPSNSELIIYEILMRDFLSDKNYKSLLDTLDYLSGLGVNAIELMPISEFEGNQSWGYNPSFHMAVDKYYGSRDQLKAVIDACHNKGIAVILDVVFNHAFSQSPLCQLYWNPAEFRPSSESPYLNETAKHPFNVGYDFNHESNFTKDWVKQILSYWIEEFKFDGFRFDLSKGLTQTFSGSNASAMSQYDQSRIDILRDYADHIWSLDTNAYVIMEHFADNSEEKVLANYGMMLWGNMTHEFAEAAMGFASDLEWADYTVRDWTEPNLIAYMESHDEERMGYKLKEFGDETGDYDTKELETGMERIMAASSIYFSIPGPKMLWQFGELGYDESINRCINGSINQDCRLDPKPIHWNYFEDQFRNKLYSKLSDLTWLRNNYPVFSSRDFNFSDGNFFLKTVHLNSPDMNVVSMANFRTINSDLNPKFPYSGIWYEYFSGQELNVVDTQEKITFGPGEYRIYISEKITPPNGFYTSNNDLVENSILIAPNPVVSDQNIYLSLEKDVEVSALSLRTLDGKSIPIEYQQKATEIIAHIPILKTGMYIVQINSRKNIFLTKLIVIE